MHRLGGMARSAWAASVSFGWAGLLEAVTVWVLIEMAALLAWHHRTGRGLAPRAVAQSAGRPVPDCARHQRAPLTGRARAGGRAAAGRRPGGAGRAGGMAQAQRHDGRHRRQAPLTRRTGPPGWRIATPPYRDAALHATPTDPPRPAHCPARFHVCRSTAVRNLTAEEPPHDPAPASKPAPQPAAAGQLSGQLSGRPGWPGRRAGRHRRAGAGRAAGRRQPRRHHLAGEQFWRPAHAQCGRRVYRAAALRPGHLAGRHHGGQAGQSHAGAVCKRGGRGRRGGAANRQCRLGRGRCHRRHRAAHRRAGQRPGAGAAGGWPVPGGGRDGAGEILGQQPRHQPRLGAGTGACRARHGGVF